MGQVNCQQCIMPYIEDIKIRQTKIEPPQPPAIPNRIHRVNILSKNRDSHQLFSKKYSTQITRQDIQQQQTNLTKSTYIKEKAIILLQSRHQIFRIQIEKGKKIMVGTSINCHFHIPALANPFKVSLEYMENAIAINDMGIGCGAFIKSSSCLFEQSVQCMKQLFIINHSYIQLTMKRSFKFGSHCVSLTIKNITQQQQQEQYKQQEQFSFKLIDILLRKQNKRMFFINCLQYIEFELLQTQENHINVCFKTTNNCWKYINQKIILKKNHILNLGSEEFKVRRILSTSSLSESLSSSSDIKIVDFDDDSD